MMIPRRLQKGDTIGIIAPSSPITPKDRQLIDNAAERFRELGLKVDNGEHCFIDDKYGISAGEPQERAADLLEMFARPDIKAIYCAQGGHTANQMLRHIDYEVIRKNPKLFIGMGDTDVLHLAIHKETGQVVFNAAEPKSGRGRELDFSHTWDALQKRLFEGEKEIPSAGPRHCIRGGKAEGTLLGCHLSSINKLIATPYLPDFEGAVLFLEGGILDMKQAVSWLEHLRQAGIFEKVTGIVIGYIPGFEDESIHTDIRASFEHLVADITQEYQTPILKTTDFGHRCSTSFLPIGAHVHMNAENRYIAITSDFLE